MRKLLHFFFLSIIYFQSAIISNVFAQTIPSNLSNNPANTVAIPPAPNAAALGKYGNTPVGYYTGIPNISVDIHTIEYGDLKLPISLSYHEGGVRVEEMASWVGLGWSLNSGGVITRTQRGTADELRNAGYWDYATNIAALDNPLSTDDGKKSFYADVLAGNADTEPDIYFFNFGNYSGKFYIGADTNIYCIPSQPIKWTKSVDSQFRMQWRATTPDGVQYTFGHTATMDGTEYTLSTPFIGTSASNVTRVSESPPSMNGSNINGASSPTAVASSWYLVKIHSPRGFDINFKYQTTTTYFTSLNSETAQYNDPKPKSLSTQDYYSFSYHQNAVTGKRLQSITYANGKIVFNPKTTYRLDFPGDKALDNIVVESVTNKDTTLIKTFKLSTNYFNLPSSSPFTESLTFGAYDKTQEITNSSYRLRLTSVQEFGADNKMIPAYTFNYYDETDKSERRSMPARLDQSTGLTFVADSYAQDHWGFYNGVLGNKNILGYGTLIPPSTAQWGTSFNNYLGADRSTNEDNAITYALKRVTYPTGGSSSYILESNKIPSSTFPSDFIYSSTPGVTACILRYDPINNPQTSASSSFTINSGFYNTALTSPQYGAYVTINYSNNTPPPNPNAIPTPLPVCYSDAVSVTILNSSGGTVGNGAQASGNIIFLPNGTYSVKITYTGSPQCNLIYGANLQWRNDYSPSNSINPPMDLAVGGLRVKQIIDSARTPVPGLITTRTFNYEKFNSSVSSGVILDFPRYGWGLYRQSFCGSFAGFQNTANGYYWVRNTFTNIPLATTQGSTVGYGNVTVYEDSGMTGANGKTEYTFTTAANYGDDINPAFPFPSACSYDWKRGLQKQEKHYKNVAGNFIPVARKNNYYTFDSPPVGNTTFSFNFSNSTQARTTVPMSTLFAGTVLVQMGVTGENPLGVAVTGGTCTIGAANCNSGVTIGTGCGAVSLPALNYQAAGLQVALYATASSPITATVCGTIYFLTGNKPVLFNNSRGRKVGVAGVTYTCSDGTLPGLTLDSLAFADYDTRAEWYVMDSTITTTYDQNDTTKTFAKIERFKFSTIHQQMITHSITTSNADMLVENYSYPLDFSTTDPAIQSFTANHIWTPVIEKYVLRQDAHKNNQRVISGEFNSYVKSSLTPNYPVLDKKYMLATATSIPFGGTTFSPATNQSGTMKYNKAYGLRVNNTAYDVFGNTLQFSKPGGAVTSYCWGYNNALPVAEIKNAINNKSYTSGGIIESSYEGCEAVTTTPQFLPHGGINYCAAYSPTFALPNTRSYVIEYWFYNSKSQWQYNKKAYTGPTTLTDGSAYDDIRIYPADAEMKSFNYDPVMGVTSMIDEGGRVLYYDYDSFGRLQRIRDDRGKVEKQFSYHYKH